MPELPEVETTINEIRPDVLNKKITSIQVLAEKSVAEPSATLFQKELTGRRITEITRRGKHLIFKLDNLQFLIVHLRMTGVLLVKPADEEPDKHDRIILYLDNRTAIHFKDLRRFGRMWLVDDLEKVVGKLGIEPFDPAFTVEALGQILKNRATPVKSLLLDQTLIAGIGNMYADEALYQARIHPVSPANSLTRAEIVRLHDAIISVLQQGIQNKGASTENYIRPSGTKGEAHLTFKVAHRKGVECPVCGGPVERIVVGQRGTFYCPTCQKLKRGSNKVQ